MKSHVDTAIPIIISAARKMSVLGLVPLHLGSQFGLEGRDKTHAWGLYHAQRSRKGRRRVVRAIGVYKPAVSGCAQKAQG